MASPIRIWVNIEKTRQILGNKIAHLSDEELIQLIQSTDQALEAMFILAVKKAGEK